MRPANLSLKVFTVAAQATISFAALAQVPPPPPPAPSLAAAPAVSNPDVPRAPSAASVQAVAVGKSTSAAVQVGTLRELEALQRETALAEARKKLRDLSPPPAVSAPPLAPPTATQAAGPGATPVVAKPKTNPRKVGALVAPPGNLPVFATSFELNRNALVEPPKAKLVNLMVIGGRARADVMDGVRMFTVKEGDKLGLWTVARISSEGVMVERRYTEMVRAPAVTLTLSEGARPAVADAFPRAYAYMNNAGQTYSEVERVETKVLESAVLSDIAVALAGSNIQLPAGGGNAAAALPPLPALRKPDSTSPIAVPPLPPALGGNAAGDATAARTN